MRNLKLSVFILALLGGACSEDKLAQGSGQRLGSEDARDAASEERDDPGEITPTGDAGNFLQRCVRGGGSVGMIHVVFECDSITVYSCKDLSNVVLEFENGDRQRFMGLHGQVGTFSGTGGGRIVGVWVKAGDNGSGDGPGYGERFDAPEDNCRPPGGGTGGSNGGGGRGGGGHCGSNDPDAFCGDSGIGGSGGSGGSGGGNPTCNDLNDPRCHIE